MSELAVELDGQCEFVMEHIPVLAMLVASDSRLAVAPRQSMRLLNISHVQVLKQRVNSGQAGLQQRRDVSAPSKSGAPVNGPEQDLLSGEPAAEGQRQPAQRLIEARCAVAQVEYRLLDPGARRQPRRVDRLIGVEPGMDNNARQPGNTPARRNAHVYERSRPIEKPVEFRGALAAQRRPRPGAQDCCPEDCLATGVAGEYGVDTSVQPLPP